MSHNNGKGNVDKSDAGLIVDVEIFRLSINQTTSWRYNQMLTYLLTMRA